MEHRELNHVALHVEDVEKSCEFYERVLDLKPIPRPCFNFPGEWYQLGDAQELHLIGERDKPVNSHPRSNHFALMIDDMDAWEAHLKALKIDYYERRTRPDGAFQIYVTDPDGHSVELCTAPPNS
jgi:catechol 2,3-dioxygenase-like lactoylglutathione lyase family enzyme